MGNLGSTLLFMTEKDEVYSNHNDNSSGKETQSKNKSTNQENNQTGLNFGKMSKNINLIDFNGFNRQSFPKVFLFFL